MESDETKLENDGVKNQKIKRFSISNNDLTHFICL